MAIECAPAECGGISVWATRDETAIIERLWGQLRDKHLLNDIVPNEGFPWTPDHKNVKSWLVTRAEGFLTLSNGNEWYFELRPHEYIEWQTAPKEPKGQVWVAEGKLYERQSDGSVRCWSEEHQVAPDTFHAESLLAETLKCDVERYQEVEAYINNVPLADWLEETKAEFQDWFDRHTAPTANGPTKPPPSVDPEALQVFADIPIPPLRFALWRWSQGIVISNGSPTFETVKVEAEEFAKKTTPVRIILSAKEGIIEHMEFGWDARNKLVPLSQLNALPRVH